MVVCARGIGTLTKIHFVHTHPPWPQQHWVEGLLLNSHEFSPANARFLLSDRSRDSDNLGGICWVGMHLPSSRCHCHGRDMKDAPSVDTDEPVTQLLT